MADYPFCYIHGEEPTPPGGYYWKCDQCFHIFATEEDLVREDLLVRANVSLPAEPLRSEDITVCPLCTDEL